MSDKFCQKHQIRKEDMGDGGWIEMRCSKCDAEAVAAYNAPGEANKRTRASAERKKRAKLRRQRR